MGRVTTTEQDLRGQAEAALAALAGPQARLREDQWTAIHALVAQRRRALVVQRARRATRPTKAAKVRRLESKRRTSERKDARRRPRADD